MDKRTIAAAFRDRLQLPARRRARRHRRLPARHRHRPLGAQPVPRPATSTGCRAPRRCAGSPRRAASPSTGCSACRTRREGRQEVAPSVQIEVGRGPERRLADRPVAARGGGHEAALRPVEPARHARPRRGRARSPTARPSPASRRTCSAASVSATWTWRSPCRCRRCATSPQGAGLWRGDRPRPPPPPARAHGGDLRRDLPDAAPAPLRRPRRPSPRPSPSSAASAPRSISARPTSSSPRPSRSRRCRGSSTTSSAAPSSARTGCRTCSRAGRQRGMRRAEGRPAQPFIPSQNPFTLEKKSWVSGLLSPPAASNSRSSSRCRALRFTGVSTCELDVEVARPGAAQRRHALAAQPELLARLHPGRHLDPGLAAIERRRVDLAAERCRRHRRPESGSRGSGCRARRSGASRPRGRCRDRPRARRAGLPRPRPRAGCGFRSPRLPGC